MKSTTGFLGSNLDGLCPSMMPACSAARAIVYAVLSLSASRWVLCKGCGQIRSSAGEAQRRGVEIEELEAGAEVEELLEGSSGRAAWEGKRRTVGMMIRIGHVIVVLGGGVMLSREERG